VKPISITLVEDQQLFREGMQAMLRKEADIKIQSGHADGASLLSWLATQKELPDIVLMDMHMPGMNGMELTELLQRSHPSIKVIVLTVYDQHRFISKMVAIGVAGYLVKNSDIEEVLLAIRTVHKTGFYFNENTVQAMRDGYRHKNKASSLRTLNNIPVDLSDRELEVLTLICKEHTNTEIAEQLHISPRTVDGHRNNLLLKTGSRNTAGLIVFAIANELYEIALSGRRPF
jgi:DNA-binding NarL/FixJ family response regulator